MSGYFVQTRCAHQPIGVVYFSQVWHYPHTILMGPPRWCDGFMLKKQQPKVFPLHLAPIDAFFCADDQPGYPMTSVIHLDFSGTLDRGAFEAALDDALERHPLLSSLIKPAKRALPCWVSADGLKPWMDWGTLDEPIQCPGSESIDLRREVGLRIWFRVGDDACRITLQVHHACTDGTGVYRFLGDLLACYGIRTGDGKDLPELSNVDPRLLRDRRRRMSKTAQGSARSFVKTGLGHAWDVFGKRVRPLSTPAAATPSPKTSFPGICSRSFTRDEHKALRAAAGAHGVMLNDLLLAEMFQTVRQWNQQLDNQPGRDWLRIMMPYDLRDKDDYEMPAANMTSYTFITRRSSDCEDFDRLVRDIRDETARIKHGRMGTTFIDAIMLADFAPRVLRYLLGRDRCISTVILSNIGEPSRRFTARLPRRRGKVVCGNLVLEAICGVPPLRKRSHATWAIFTYAREMTISLRCDPYRFTSEQTAALLDIYMQRLARHLPSST